MTKVIFNLLQPKLLKWGKAAFWIATFLLCFSAVAVAKPNETAPPNPLEITTPDPLLPNPPVERALTPVEQANLREALDQLNEQAAAQLSAGNSIEAYKIWYREIRLRRVLGGPLEEVQALGRVGEIAWSQNSKPEVQLITTRLETIQKEAETKKTLDEPLLRALGRAYEQIRVPGQALKVYEQILATERQRNDPAAVETTLKTIAQLHLAWFDYPKAAAAYEELLATAQAKGDRVNQLVYLKELINIYDKSKQPENALRTKQQLVEKYLNEQDFTQIPALKIAIAADYEALNQPEEASQNYQEAYTLAFSSQQFAYASDALLKLGNLYRSHSQPDFALQVYDVLLKVEQQSYNYYGLMNAYDQMGQIHLEQKNYAQALSAFQQGLELAKSLQYQESYFSTQIERVNQQSSQ
jgi:tetratricopeptide (TPR) repeat protein